MTTRADEVQPLEIQEYISAFKSSSDRARYIIYVNVIISLLLLVGTWNTTSWSWSRRRIATAEAPLRAEYLSDFERRHPPPGAVTPAPKQPPVAYPTVAAWEQARDAYVKRQMTENRATEYRKAALQRILFVPVPGLGLHVDVNDLGLLGGFTLLVLALLLCLSMVRQHENLYLTFFKVRRLCERDRLCHHDGESMANFLYHSLAMGQVLNYPPTLARWGYGSRNKFVGLARWAVLLLPAVVHGLVFATNVVTFDIARTTWGRLAFWRMGAQFLLFCGIATLCLLAGLYSRACNYRWRTAFDLINPGLRYVQQRPWSDWLRLPGAPAADSHLRPLLTELTYSLRPDAQPEELKTGVAAASVNVSASGEPRVTQEKLIEMATKLHDEADRQLENHRGAVIQHYETTHSVILHTTWTVEVKYSYRSNGLTPSA